MTETQPIRNITDVRVGLIGVPSIPLKQGKSIKLLSKANLYPFDVIVWDPYSLDAEIGKFSNIDTGFRANWPSEAWQKIDAILQDRTARLLELVMAGSILVIVMTRPIPREIMVNGDQDI